MMAAMRWVPNLMPLLHGRQSIPSLVTWVPMTSPPMAAYHWCPTPGGAKHPQFSNPAPITVDGSVVVVDGLEDPVDTTVPLADSAEVDEMAAVASMTDDPGGVSRNATPTHGFVPPSGESTNWVPVLPDETLLWCRPSLTLTSDACAEQMSAVSVNPDGVFSVVVAAAAVPFPVASSHHRPDPDAVDADCVHEVADADVPVVADPSSGLVPSTPENARTYRVWRRFAACWVSH